jgi:hypothetical protein
MLAAEEGGFGPHVLDDAATQTADEDGARAFTEAGDAAKANLRSHHH